MPVFFVVLQVHTVMSCHGSCLRFPTAYTVLAYCGCVYIDEDSKSVRVVYAAWVLHVRVAMLLCLAFCAYLFSHLASISRPKF